MADWVAVFSLGPSSNVSISVGGAEEVESREFRKTRIFRDLPSPTE